MVQQRLRQTRTVGLNRLVADREQLVISKILIVRSHNRFRPSNVLGQITRSRYLTINALQAFRVIRQLHRRVEPQSQNCPKRFLEFRVSAPLDQNAWNEFVIAVTFLQNDSNITAIVKFYNLTGQYSTDWGEMLAAAITIVLPVVLTFVLLQRKFIDGMTAGAVK